MCPSHCVVGWKWQHSPLQRAGREARQTVGKLLFSGPRELGEAPFQVSLMKLGT